jgi:hypothetical protein
VRPVVGISIIAGIAAATLCLAAAESRVSRAAILAVEGSMNQTLSARSSDPYDLLGTARGTYLEGYGTLFTFEVDLVNAGGLMMSPFRPTITPEELAGLRDHKLKKLPELKDAMRTAMMNASATLEGLPPGERVAMEAILFSYSWEKNTKEMPRRVFMSAEKQKLLDAKANHATPSDLAAIIEEQDR